MRIHLIIAVLAGVLASNASQAAIIWNETTNGPLSTSNLSPTNLNNLPLGTSTVSGSVSGPNVDVFRFTIPAGWRLDTIILAQYVPGDSLAFIAMDSGPSFPFNRQQLNNFPDETQFIGGTTFGTGNSAVGQDLLSSSFIGGRFIGRQPTPEQPNTLPDTPPTYNSLPSGEYTVYIQQLGSLTGYTLDFGVVPEPTSASLLVVAGLVAMRRRNRLLV
jgi:hypothetical protein